MSSLRITEIFHSLQGEARDIGRPTVFVRLSGCPLRCTWCDTTYSFKAGEVLSLDTILQRVAVFDTHHVCVTGGEPLAQKGCLALLERLCDAGHSVSLETSGALDIGGIDAHVTRVMDLKTPSSGEQTRNRRENIALLRSQDQVKFVIADEHDYRWSCEQLEAHALANRCDVLFSPVTDRLAPRELAEWILHDRLPVRFQIQLHKYLWGEESGR